MRSRAKGVAVFALVAMIAATPASVAVCSNASLTGVFGYFHGRPNGLGGGTVDAVVGQITADGLGHITSGSYTLSAGGTISTGAFTGTYSISKSCGGTMTFSSEDLTPADFNIVLDNGNKGFQMIQSDQGLDQPGFGVAEGTVVCGLNGKKQVFANNILATVFPAVVPEAIVGQWILNGKGNVSGTETVSLNGTVSGPAPAQGTYTEGADCLGTATVTLEGTTMNFNTVKVNSGKELLMLETDNNTLAGGNAQLSAATCSNGSLKGVFGYFHGRPNGLPGPGVNEVEGQFTADGLGNLTGGSFTWNAGGTVTTGSFTGSYSIAKNCTGTMTFSTEDQTPSDFNIYLDNGNKGFQMIQSDPGNDQPGFGVAQGTVTCGLTGKKQTLATNIIGTLYPSDDPEAVVGQVKLDGFGHISGNEMFSVNYVNSVASVTGTYTEGANCLGTATITPSGSGTTNFNTVRVNSGKELLLIETDASTLVGGTAQQ